MTDIRVEDSVILGIAKQLAEVSEEARAPLRGCAKPAFDPPLSHALEEFWAELVESSQVLSQSSGDLAQEALTLLGEYETLDAQLRQYAESEIVPLLNDDWRRV